MLVQFSLSNFKTFKEKATLSLVASNYSKEHDAHAQATMEPTPGLRLLKSAVVYGANASGKSKLLEAIRFMKQFVLTSSKNSQTGDQIAVDPFRLCTETEGKPSEFEIVFLLDGVLYRYGFEADKTHIVAEWLYFKPKTKEVELFYREGDDYSLHDRLFPKGKMVVKEKLVRSNALLLSVAAQFNDAKAIAVLAWFERLTVIAPGDSLHLPLYNAGSFERPLVSEKITELLMAADTGISEVLFNKEAEITKAAKGLPLSYGKSLQFSDAMLLAPLTGNFKTGHKKYDGAKLNTSLTHFDMHTDESAGTQKLFQLAGPIVSALQNGSVLVVDELDSQLHHLLTSQLVGLFHSQSVNKTNAQLIFNTHNTTLLGTDFFRRDQVWFVEKSRFGEARLFSLADFKTNVVRKNDRFEDNYLKGKYGGVPHLGYFHFVEQTPMLHASEPDSHDTIEPGNYDSPAN